MKEYPNLEGGLTMYQPRMRYYTDGRYPDFEETWYPNTDQNTEPCPKSELVSEMLTPSEIEQLRQEKKELVDWQPKAFAHLKKKE